MLVSPSAAVIGSTNMPGIKAPGAIVIDGEAKPLGDTLFIQNDGDKTPTSPWFVKQICATHYTMLNATAPKGWQYLGAFIISGETGQQIGRADGAVWTFSDSEIVKHISTSAKGQAAVSILKAGTCTLTVTLRDMVSTLVITAVDAS